MTSGTSDIMRLEASYLSRFQQLREFTDINKAVRLFEQASKSSEGRPITRMNASHNWAKISLQYHISSPLEASRRIMSLVPEVIWMGTTVSRRYKDIASINHMVVDAAATAIELGAYDLALEWLEQGRSIVWGQILRLRTPFDDLAAINPTLSLELKQVSQELEQVSVEPLETRILLDKPSLENAAQRHRRLAERWKHLVDQARNDLGGHNFLQPKNISDLVHATHSGAVVVLCIHQSRCDALALLPNSSAVMHIPLSSFSYQKAKEAHSQLLDSLHHADVRTRHDRRPMFYPTASNDNFETVLRTLWSDVAKPVLERLDYLKILPTEELPHVTWCTTGPLSFLPLHAAGHYDEPGSRIFDYVMSSYTPTIGALHDTPQPPIQFRGTLTVGQAATFGCTPLPGTVNELDRVQTYVGHLHFTRLEGDQATSSAVLKAMDEHSWVHLACHASQNISDPRKSAFHLHGSQLDLATITQKPLKGAQMAFLSACETAMGDEKLPEEAVHLAAGMIMAGYPTVVATMWSIRDEDAPIIAEEVYAHLLAGGVPDARRAAKALHTALGHLRDKVGVKAFARWVPYIHMGI